MGLLSGIGSVFNDISGLSSNQANAQRYAREMFDRQVELANTAHQREVNDLLAAGLNPVLSATGGNGASTPTGVSSPVGTGGGLSAVSSLSNMLGELMQLSLLEDNRNNLKAQAANAKSAAVKQDIANALDSNLVHKLGPDAASLMRMLERIPSQSFVGNITSDLVKSNLGFKAATGKDASNALMDKASDPWLKQLNANYKRKQASKHKKSGKK